MMQMKHLIIITLTSIFLLIGFNLFNGNKNAQNRAEMVDSTPVIVETETTGMVDVTSKPLGEQPKAMMDKATTQISQVEQADQQRAEQIDNVQ